MVNPDTVTSLCVVGLVFMAGIAFVVCCIVHPSLRKSPEHVRNRRRTMRRVAMKKCARMTDSILRFSVSYCPPRSTFIQQAIIRMWRQVILSTADAQERVRVARAAAIIVSSICEADLSIFEAETRLLLEKDYEEYNLPKPGFLERFGLWRLRVVLTSSEISELRAAALRAVSMKDRYRFPPMHCIVCGKETHPGESMRLMCPKCAKGAKSLGFFLPSYIRSCRICGKPDKNTAFLPYCPSCHLILLDREEKLKRDAKEYGRLHFRDDVTIASLSDNCDD